MIIPVIPIIVAIADQVFKVSFSLVPEYLLISQNPLSLKCTKLIAPHPIAITTSVGFVPVAAMTGAIIPAAVVMDTVADPTEIRIIVAIKYAINMGLMLACDIISARLVPIPLSISTCLKTPF